MEYISCEECGKEFRDSQGISGKRAEHKLKLHKRQCIKIKLEETETYCKVIEHRAKCPKWTTGFCLECFGGGLVKFTGNLNRELQEMRR